jgi:MerR family copper efflux transcriptional regulator
MKIGELASRSGVSTQTIRYYENIGVLPEAGRKPNGYRNYDDSAVKRLAFIRDAQTSGLSLDEIQLILDMKDAGESTCSHVIGMLEGHLSEVDRQIGDLERTRVRLEQIVSQAKRMNPSNCTDPNRCQTITSES